MAKNKSLRGQLLLLCAALIWGSSFLIVKNTTENIPPLFLLAVRFTIACALLSIIFYKRVRKTSKSDLINGAVIGVFLFLAYTVQTIGITDTTPGKNAFLTAVYCVIVPFLNGIVFREKPKILSIGAAILCLAGVGCVALNEGFSIRTGDILTLVGGVFFACHIVAITKCGKDRDPIVMTIVQFGVSAILSWVFGLSTSKFPTNWTISEFGGILYLAVFATAAALLLQNIGQKYAPPASSSIILSLESVFGVLFSVLFYGERPTSQMYIGFVLIFLSVLLTETGDIFLEKIKRRREI